ncbi:MAG: hypothetical protein ACRDA5_14530, partial [Clostridium sp.]
DIVTKEGLSKKDIPLLEAMLKFDIPLSRENIKMVKGLVQFNDKIQGNPKEIENFISKYLESKGIDPNSSKGQVVTQKLQDFFNAFKSLSNEDVLLFLENNIEFTKETIESYNKLFKDQGKGLDIVNEMKNELGKILTDGESELLKLGNNIEVNKEIKSGSEAKKNENLVNIKSDDNSPSKLNNGAIAEKGIIGDKIDALNNLAANIEKVEQVKVTTENPNSIKGENSNNKLATGAYEKNDFAQNKISVLSVLKSLMGEGENQLNVELKDLINSKRAEFTTKEFDKAYNAINKIDDGSFISMIEDAKLGTGDLSFNKTELESALSKAVGKNITVSEEQYNKIKDIINLKLTEGKNNDLNKVNVKPTENIKTLIKDKVTSEEVVKSTVPLKGIDSKELTKSIIADIKSGVASELKDLINSKRSEFTTKEFDKAYNAINKIDDASFISMIEDAIDEYNNSPQKEANSFSDYINKKKDDAKFGSGDLSFNKTELESALSKAVGKNITVSEEQYNKIKDIINLKLTEGENQGAANGLDKMNGQTIGKDSILLDIPENISDETVEGESETTKTAVNTKSDNTENLKSLIKDKLTSQEVVKSSISSKGQEGKDIIKEIISSIKSESAVSEKILDVIKNNMSDVKLFNKISQEYYYLNVPVKIKEQEYPCKLILKDNRKDGKKIDSKNVKMVVTVKTVNLGVVDGYIKVLENKIDIDLKCEKSFMKILDLGKEKLISNIKDLGFNISVNISKKEEEVSLTSCRKFFNENNRVNLDIKV